MPTVDEFWRIAAQVAAERGGLVVGFTRDSEQPELGSALDNVLGFTPQARITVASLSDWADWIEQVEAFYRLKPDWGRGKRGNAEANYYRVKVGERFEGNFAGNSGAFGRATSYSTPNFGAGGGYSSINVQSFGGSAGPLSGFQGVKPWPRALARVIDFVVHYVAAILATFLFGVILAAAAGGHPPPEVVERAFQTHFAVFMAAILGLFAYNVICTSTCGITVGKMLLRMQVIADDGSPCRPKAAIIRELGYFVDTMFFGLVGYFAMKDDPEQQRLGDEWAGTIVCKRDEVPSATQRDGKQFVVGLMFAIAADIALRMIGLLIQMNL